MSDVAAVADAVENILEGEPHALGLSMQPP